MIDLEKIARETARIKSLTKIEQTNILAHALKEVGLVDELWEVLNDQRVKAEIMQNRRFAMLCNIPYGQIDMYWQTIISATAEYCRIKYKSRKQEKE